VKGRVQIVTGVVDRLDRYILRWAGPVRGGQWRRWSEICRSDRDDSDGFNSIESNAVWWKRQYHYCAMPLSDIGLEDVVLYPAGSASEAWLEWRATGLVRVLLLHNGPNCQWNVGPVYSDDRVVTRHAATRDGGEEEGE